MKWTLIVLGLLMVLVIVLAALNVGGSTKHKAAASKGLGSRANPVLLRRADAIGGGWQMKVLRVTPNANRQVLAITSYGEHLNVAPPRGAQDFVVTLSLTYTGGGKSSVSDIVDYGLNAMGTHNAPYDTVTDSCGQGFPSGGLQESEVFSGQTVGGSVCFQVAKNDVKTLMLYTGTSQSVAVLGSIPGLKRVWFALR